MVKQRPAGRGDMARGDNEDTAAAVCFQGGDSADRAGGSRKKFLYISPLKAQDTDLTMTQRNEVQDKKQTAFIDLDAVWNIKRNMSLGDLKTARSSLSSTNKYYSRYGGCRAYSGTGPNIHKLPRTMESNPDRKWSSKSKEKLGNRSAHNSLSEED